MKHVIKLGIAFILLNSWLIATTTAGTLSARVDHANVHFGETIELVITLTGVQADVVPDFSALNKDFDIHTTSRQISFVKINGNAENKTTWMVSLEPKNIGNLNIPALTIDGQSTKPIRITVIEPVKYNPQSQANKTDNVFIEAKLNPAKPYEKSEAIYVLKVFYNSSIQQPHFSEPAAPESKIYLLGREKTYRTVINGAPYQVLEQRYAVVPNKSGYITIKGPKLSGKMMKTNTGAHSDFSTQRWQSFSVAANDVKMHVKKAPANTKHHWLPAVNVSAAIKWSDTGSSASVGQPITLTIHMEAIGATADQLPDLSKMTIEGFQIYPDKAETETTTDGQHLIGKRIEKIALIPQQSGQLEIPSIKIPWWNIKTQKTETITLKGKTIQVSGLADTQTEPTPIMTLPAKRSTTQESSPSPLNLWMWTAIVISLLWIGSMAIFLRPQRSEKSNSLGDKPSWKKFKEACRRNDPRAASKTLRQAAQLEWPEHKLNNLQDISNLLSDMELTKALDHLQEVLYNNNTVNEWDGKSLAKALMSARAKHIKAEKPSSGGKRLKELYPNA